MNRLRMLSPNALNRRLLSFSALLVFPLLSLLSGSKAQCEGDLRIGSLRVNKVIFLGNSITLHPPAPQLGWNGHWGMAASSREKDYVHLLVQRISSFTGKAPAVLIKNIGEFERKLGEYGIEDELADVARFEADLVILAIGENCQTPTTEVDRQKFSRAMNHLLSHLQKHGHPTILVRSQFWPDEAKDSLLKQAAGDNSAIWVDLGLIGSDPNQFAQAERKFAHERV